MASISLGLLRLSLPSFAELTPFAQSWIVHSTCLPSSNIPTTQFYYQFYSHLANMSQLPSRTLCRCIPVRFLVLTMSILGCIVGSVMGGFGWDSAVHKGKRYLILLYHVLIIFVEETYLTRNQEVSVVMASLSYTILAVISLFGSVRFVPPNSEIRTLTLSSGSLELSPDIALSFLCIARPCGRT